MWVEGNFWGCFIQGLDLEAMPLMGLLGDLRLTHSFAYGVFPLCLNNNNNKPYFNKLFPVVPQRKWSVRDRKRGGEGGRKRVSK